jgi:SAM-dependent methyltransferase
LGKRHLAIDKRTDTIDQRGGVKAVLEFLKRQKKKLGNLYWEIYTKEAFIRSCPPNARVLDVGCGNRSPYNFKSIRPDLYYVGIDIGDCNQDDDSIRCADEYIVVPVGEFNHRIAGMAGRFDAVVSAHNIEHCDDPDATMQAMLAALKPGGRLFMAFPTEASVRFPRRGGTLNFFDDPTHKTVPDFAAVCAGITAAGYRLDVAIRRYRPLRGVLAGLRHELPSMWRKHVMWGTWALYGFESIILATRM